MPFLHEIRIDGVPGDRWPIGRKPFVVGRGDLVDGFVDDDALSRSHFLIVQEGTEYFVIDLESANGTWVENQPVKGQKLSPGQVIRAGNSLFCFSNKELLAAGKGLELPAPQAEMTAQAGIAAA